MNVFSSNASLASASLAKTTLIALALCLAGHSAFGHAGAAGGFAAGITIPTLDLTPSPARPPARSDKFGRFSFAEDYHGEFIAEEERYSLFKQGHGRYFVKLRVPYQDAQEFAVQCDDSSKTCVVIPGLEGNLRCPSTSFDLLPDGSLLVRNPCRGDWKVARYL